MGAIISFLGGGAFRAVWGEVSTWLNNKQTHTQEMERMKLQSDLDSARAGQQLAAMAAQSAAGIQTIREQSAAAMSVADADAFTAGIKAAAAPTGVKWVDAWNGAVRPAYATVALLIWIGLLCKEGFVASVWDLELMGSVAGFFFADRSLRRSAGK